VPTLSNSSPLILLSRIGRLQVLPDLFGEITIPAGGTPRSRHRRVGTAR
jgi:predicted nucleic acid-binding protein